MGAADAGACLRDWPDGKSFAVADIQENPAAFHRRECCDPVEGTSYQSRNCAIIYTNGPRLEINSRAHGDAFADVAPLDDITLSLSEAAGANSGGARHLAGGRNRGRGGDG